MFFKYISFWIILQFILWSVGYLLGITYITNYVNPYYTSIFMCIGYVLYVIYLLCKRYKFTDSFLAFNTMAHFIPLYVSYKYVRNKYSVENLIVILLLYSIYMLFIKEDPFTIYFLDEQPTSWNDLYNMFRL